MIFNNKKKKEELIILNITSFFQINNFLSFFLEKRLLVKKKICLVIFSETIPENLILEFIENLKKFVDLEFIDLRRKNIVTKKFLKIRYLSVFMYYFGIFKKLINIKKFYRVEYLSTYTKLQISNLILIIFLLPNKIFLLEDGLRDYVPQPKKLKVTAIFYIFKKFLNFSKCQLLVLQLANMRSDYLGLLKEPFLQEKNFFDNKNFFKNFCKINLDQNKVINPKCILIGTKSTNQSFEYNKNLYLRTIEDVKTKYNYDFNQIIFLPHPREEDLFLEKLKVCLSGISKIKLNSSIVVENYLANDNLELVIGAFSSTLYYAKVIFKKKNVYYLENFKNSNQNNVKINKYVSIYNSFNIKNYFN